MWEHVCVCVCVCVCACVSVTVCIPESAVELHSLAMTLPARHSSTRQLSWQLGERRRGDIIRLGDGEQGHLRTHDTEHGDKCRRSSSRTNRWIQFTDTPSSVWLLCDRLHTCPGSNPPLIQCRLEKDAAPCDPAQVKCFQIMDGGLRVDRSQHLLSFYMLKKGTTPCTVPNGGQKKGKKNTFTHEESLIISTRGHNKHRAEKDNSKPTHNA